LFFEHAQLELHVSCILFLGTLAEEQAEVDIWEINQLQEVDQSLSLADNVYLPDQLVLPFQIFIELACCVLLTFWEL